jgi:hypothetical protein
MLKQKKALLLFAGKQEGFDQPLIDVQSGWGTIIGAGLFTTVSALDSY